MDKAINKVELVGLERSKHNNKLAVKFDVYNKTGEYVMGTFTSAHVFRSYGAAIKGARRALQVIAETGKFPNMCQPF